MREIALILTLGLGVAVFGQEPRRPVPQFEPAEITLTAEAKYPPNTVAAGTVILQVTVGETGAAEQIRVVRDIAPLTTAAERALRQWKFKSATLDGRPVRSVIPVAFTFVRPVLNP